MVRHVRRLLLPQQDDHCGRRWRLGSGGSHLPDQVADKVYVIHRDSTLRACKTMQNRAFDNPKIEFVFNKTVERIYGHEKIVGVRLHDTLDGSETNLDLEGFFIAIGVDPRTHLVHGKLDFNPDGTIAVQGRSSRTASPAFSPPATCPTPLTARPSPRQDPGPFDTHSDQVRAPTCERSRYADHPQHVTPGGSRRIPGSAHPSSGTPPACRWAEGSQVGISRRNHGLRGPWRAAAARSAGYRYLPHRSPSRSPLATCWGSRSAAAGTSPAQESIRRSSLSSTRSARPDSSQSAELNRISDSRAPPLTTSQPRISPKVAITCPPTSSLSQRSNRAGVTSTR